jgi:hypothetical protein
MDEGKHEIENLLEAKVKLTFNTEPNPEVIETVRKMLLTHYEETKQE